LRSTPHRTHIVRPSGQRRHTIALRQRNAHDGDFCELTPLHKGIDELGGPNHHCFDRVTAHAAHVDDLIASHLQGWTLERLPAVRVKGKSDEVEVFRVV